MLYYILMSALYLVPNGESSRKEDFYEFTELTPDTLPPYEGQIERSEIYTAISGLFNNIVALRDEEYRFIMRSSTWRPGETPHYEELVKLEEQVKGAAAVLEVVAPLNKTWGELWPKSMLQLKKMNSGYPMLRTGPYEIAKFTDDDEAVGEKRKYSKAREYQRACDRPCGWEAWINHAINVRKKPVVPTG